MDPRTWAQDVLRCRLCETPSPHMYCDICNIYLCKACVDEHLSDRPNEHSVIPFQNHLFPNLCRIHSSKECELFCEQCEKPICVKCASSKEHSGHGYVGMVKALDSQKAVLNRDLQELEKFVLPKYHEIAKIVNNFPVEKDIKENIRKSTAAIDKHGDELHREIDNIIKQMKSDLDKMSQNIEVLKKHKNNLTSTISEITKSIADLKKLLKCSYTDSTRVFAYKSRNAEFKRLPPKLTVSLAEFSPQVIQPEQLHKQFGSLSAFSIGIEEHGYTLELPSAESSPIPKPINDEPRIITVIKTYTGHPSATKESFRPVGITTDSHGQILIADRENNRIHILDQDGQFLRYIDDCGLDGPYGLCVDTRNNLFVSESDTGKVKKIGYM